MARFNKINAETVDNNEKYKEILRFTLKQKAKILQLSWTCLREYVDAMHQPASFQYMNL